MSSGISLAVPNPYGAPGCQGQTAPGATGWGDQGLASRWRGAMILSWVLPVQKQRPAPNTPSLTANPCITRSLAPPVEVEYTLNRPMASPDPSSCSRSPNRRPGRSHKGLGDRPVRVHPPHEPRESRDRGPIGAGGWRQAVSFNQVLAEAHRVSGADRTFSEGFR
jgi:hypothetical protein